MKYLFFVTRRYLVTRFIPWAAVLAVAFGVLALITVLSVMEGFKVEMRQRIRGSLAHLTIHSQTSRGLFDEDVLAERVAKLPQVKAVAPFVEHSGIYRLQLSGGLSSCVIRGIEPLAEAGVSDFATYLLRDSEIQLLLEYPQLGHLPDERQPLEPHEIEEIFSRERRTRIAKATGVEGVELGRGVPQPIVVGIEALRRRRLSIGHVVQIQTFSPLTLEPKVANFIVVGAFKIGEFNQDMSWMFMPIRACQEFLDFYDTNPDINDYRFSGLSVKLDDYGRSEQVKTTIRQEVFPHLRTRIIDVETWEDQRKNLLQAVDIEKTIVGAMMMLLVCFAGFVIFLILTLLVIEKTRDLGVLRSLGATAGGIVGIFMLLGFFLVSLGIVLGGFTGWVFLNNINEVHDWIYEVTGWQLFPPDIYYLTEIPVAFRVLDLLLILGSANAFGLLGSLIPALIAARKDPIKALRHE